MLIKKTLLIYFFGLFVLIWNTNVNADNCNPADVIITPTNCVPTDFDGGKSCTLQCSVSYDTSRYNVSGMCWTYFADDSSTNIHLFDNISNSTTTNTTLMKLQLSTYYSGIYSCQIILEEPKNDDSSCNAGNNFNIANNTSPVPLNKQCAAPTECVTFNAYCDTTDTRTCLCQTPYDYYYPEGTANPIACLQDSSIDGPCNLDEQCPTNDGFECDDYLCDCDGTVAIVTDFDGGADNKTTKCLQKVKPNQECLYNEECTSFDSHTKCEDGKCKCIGDYADRGLEDDGHCKEDLTDADIAGIAVAGVFALGVIAIIARCVIEKCCCSGKKEEDDDVEKVEEKYN